MLRADKCLRDKVLRGVPEGYRTSKQLPGNSIHSYALALYINISRLYIIWPRDPERFFCCVQLFGVSMSQKLYAMMKRKCQFIFCKTTCLLIVGYDLQQSMLPQQPQKFRNYSVHPGTTIIVPVVCDYRGCQFVTIVRITSQPSCHKIKSLRLI